MPAMARSVTRRRLLKLAVGAGGAVAAGGAGLLGLRGRAPDVQGLSVLSPHQYRTMSALATALIPRGGPFALGAEDADLARAFDGYLADEPSWAQDEAKGALTLLEYGPLLFERRLATFSNLGPEERLAHYATWATSTLALRRQAALGFRKFLSLVFYDSPAVWPDLRYEGPLIKE